MATTISVTTINPPQHENAVETREMFSPIPISRVVNSINAHRNDWAIKGQLPQGGVRNITELFQTFESKQLMNELINDGFTILYHKPSKWYMVGVADQAKLDSAWDQLGNFMVPF